MNKANIDLNLFKVFDVIYREGSITKAAQTLGITQPAVSNSLSRLRQLFDDELFTRSSRGMKPTTLAQNIQPSINSALMLLRDCIDEGDCFQPSNSTISFNLCMNAVAQVSIMPRLVAGLQTNAPNLKLSTQTIYSCDVVKSLSNETIDLAVEYAIPTPEHIKRHLLFDDDYVCIMREDHPVIKDSISLNEYKAASHLVLAEETRESSGLLTALAENNIVQKTVVVSSDYIGLPAVLVESDAIATITRTIASTLQNYLGIKILTPPFEIPRKKTFMYWHENEDQNSANKWLRDQVRLTAGLKKGSVEDPLDLVAI